MKRPFVKVTTKLRYLCNFNQQKKKMTRFVKVSITPNVKCDVFQKCTFSDYKVVYYFCCIPTFLHMKKN